MQQSIKKVVRFKLGSEYKYNQNLALEVTYSVAEYAAPVWARSPYAQNLITELNSGCRQSVTSCRGAKTKAILDHTGVPQCSMMSPTLFSFI